MMKKFTIYSAILLSFLSFKSNSTELNAGPWRFELKYEHATVPFIIEFNWDNKRLIGTLFNGKETIKLKDIIFSGHKLKIPLQTYEASLELKIEGPNRVVGEHIRYNKSPILKTPIVGTFGQKERFLDSKKAPSINLTGKWEITLSEEGTETKGVAIFDQTEGTFTGSILTPTGDYRYLEGFVSGKTFKAASFDGIFNYVFEGNLTSGKLSATLLSNSITSIVGTKNSEAKLPDAYAQTQLEALEFSFPNLKGKMISLTDKEFKNKAIIVQFFGSWCPNCMDEMNYLIPWYQTNKNRGVEVIALAFERSASPAESKRQLNKVQKKNNVPYSILIAGTSADEKPIMKIPNLKNFISFPTTVFLNKKHQVIKVHAGFSGPGTGEFFEKWKMEFEENVKLILK